MSPLMARPLRIEYPGAVYHVIARGNNRQAIFADDHDRTTYLQKLVYYCTEKEVRLLGYCLLSNHLHLLLETPQGNLSKLMQPLQTSFTLSFNRRHRQSGHVFEQRYKALVVDRDNYLVHVSRYIHLNPVAAKLVQRPQDYPWSSYRAYLKESSIGGVQRELILGQFAGKGRQRVVRYREFVEGALKTGEPWAQLPLHKQVFVGEEEFVETTERQVQKVTPAAGRYRLAAIVQGVCEVLGVGKEELRSAGKEEWRQRGREMLMYLARQYSGVSPREVLPYLGARDGSTVSHGVRRAERRVKEERGFRQQVEQVLRSLSSSHIQA